MYLLNLHTKIIKYKNDSHDNTIHQWYIYYLLLIYMY